MKKQQQLIITSLIFKRLSLDFHVRGIPLSLAFMMGSTSSISCHSTEPQLRALSKFHPTTDILTHYMEVVCIDIEETSLPDSQWPFSTNKHHRAIESVEICTGGKPGQSNIQEIIAMSQGSFTMNICCKPGLCEHS